MYFIRLHLQTTYVLRLYLTSLALAGGSVGKTSSHNQCTYRGNYITKGTPAIPKTKHHYETYKYTCTMNLKTYTIAETATVSAELAYKLE